MKQRQDMRTVWKMLYTVRTRHPVLVFRAAAQLVRARLQRVVIAGYSARPLLNEMWPALEKIERQPGQPLTYELITLAGTYYREMLCGQSKKSR